MTTYLPLTGGTITGNLAIVGNTPLLPGLTVSGGLGVDSLTALAGTISNTVITTSAPDSSLDLNFLSGMLDSRIAFTRASTATYFDNTGTMQLAASGVARFDHDPATLAPLGLSIEGTGTNNVRNPRCEGAVVGSIGGTGVYPTNWTYDPGPLPITVIGTGYESGIPYIDLQFSGSATGINLVRPDVFNINPSDNYIHSSYVRLVGGSLTNVSMIITCYTYGGGTNNFQTITPTTAPLATQRYSATSTGGTGEYSVSPGFQISCNGAVNVTLRFGGPQCEAGLFATSLILPPIGSPAATTRAIEVATMPTGSWFNQSLGSFYTEVQGNVVLPANWATSYSINLAGPLRMATSYSSSAVSYGLNGTIVFNDSGIAAFPTALTTLQLGTPTNAAQGSQWMRRIRYWNRALSITELQQVTSTPASMINVAIDQSPIGSTTPSSGSFTSLQTSGPAVFAASVSGAGITSLVAPYYLASNPTGFQTAAQVTAAVPVAASTTPAIDGTAAIGTSTTWARADHIHPTDTTRAALAGAAFTGPVTVQTPTLSTQAVNKAYVDGASVGLATIGALRANNATLTNAAFVSGWYTSGDGGGGWFTRVSSDTTSADNGGTIIIDAGGYRWYRDRVGDVYSVKWFGAKGDGTTDDTAAFTAIEATSFATIVLPDGNYAVTLAKGSLGKLYLGPGAIVYKATISESATPSVLERSHFNPLTRTAALIQTSTRRVVFIGDSITAASGLLQAQGYIALLMQKMDHNSNAPICNLAMISNFAFMTITGSYAAGTTGPLGAGSRILKPGAAITFAADYVDYVTFYYAQNLGTAGVITITDTQSGVIDVVTTTTGTNLNATRSTVPTRRCGVAQNITLTCSVAPVEINGIQVWRNDLGQSLLFQMIAYPGYTTAAFISAQTTAAIVAQTAGPQPIFIIALGTNDIFSLSVAISVAAFIANLTTICTAITAPYGGQATVILTVPLMPAAGTGFPILAPFSAYRNAIYAFARKNGYDVVDLSELDFNVSSSLLYQDGVNPNILGNQILADYWYEKLRLGNVTLAEYVRPIVPSGGFSQGAGSPMVSRIASGRAMLSGMVACPGSNPGLPTILGTIDPASCGPISAKMFTCATSTGSATVSLSRACQLVLTAISGSWPANISLDGISYSLRI